MGLVIVYADDKQSYLGVECLEAAVVAAQPDQLSANHERTKA